MNITVNIGWKSILALGGSIVAGIFVWKMDDDAPERVSIHAIDAIKDAKIAIHGKK